MIFSGSLFFLSRVESRLIKVCLLIRRNFSNSCPFPFLWAKPTKNIKRLSTLGKNELDKLGQNALNYYNNEFERTMLMDRMESTFNKMTD